MTILHFSVQNFNRHSSNTGIVLATANLYNISRKKIKLNYGDKKIYLWTIIMLPSH